jgi:rRNA maturation protein Nop10
MSNAATFFLQACPVCGRRLQVPNQLLGCGVTCQHCGGSFVANHETSAEDPTTDSRAAMRRRIEALLVAAWRRGVVATSRTKRKHQALLRPFT